MLKGWKTILFNVVTGAILLIDNLGADWGIAPGLIEGILIVGNLILRFLTSTPAMKAK